ncbi:hypothetical protein [Desulfotomaculum copahuensis]|uniref:Uncharacterized protein n=1 Tax=Desulfotomaculum copahuensis TaxID=1838280 RepID=A0A1B7LAW4_9FIRM|nr:hypothetical protein [Desulfotomaculum copahuensis]OAT79440.1 hypothetical protein A6M21_01550 [Desulfotomaculum copahuensis]
MQGNKLWESHRLILPEMREVAAHTCRECRFLVRIRGRGESRPGCVAAISRYGTLQNRVPPEIHALDILKLAGRSGLAEVLARGRPEDRACGLFMERC